MKDIDELKEFLCSTALEAYQNEYDGLLASWRNIEGKAQSTASVSGVFIAATFAFAREISSQTNLQNLDLLKKLVLLSIICLVISVISALLVMWVRSLPAPPGGWVIEEMVNDILNSHDSVKARFPAFLQDQLRMWRNTNKYLRKANTTKASLLKSSQIFLLVAILSAALSTALRIFEY